MRQVTFSTVSETWADACVYYVADRISVTLLAELVEIKFANIGKLLRADLMRQAPNHSSIPSMRCYFQWQCSDCLLHSNEFDACRAFAGWWPFECSVSGRPWYLTRTHFSPGRHVFQMIVRAIVSWPYSSTQPSCHPTLLLNLTPSPERPTVCYVLRLLPFRAFVLCRSFFTYHLYRNALMYVCLWLYYVNIVT